MLPLVDLPPEIPVLTHAMEWIADERPLLARGYFTKAVLVADAKPTAPLVDHPKNYDAAFSVCGAAVPTTHRDYEISNIVYPLAVVPDTNEPTTVAVLHGPLHGHLSPYAKFPDSVFVYSPNDGYLGPDQITFVVEQMGKKFKVIVTAWVADVPPESGGCPEGYELPPADTD